MVVYIAIALLIALDQWVKYLVVQHVTLHTGFSILDGLFSIFYIHNDGAAWGIFSGNMVFFFIVTVAVLMGLVVWFHRLKKPHVLETLAYILIVSGAIGNFIDRLRLGYVVDMFQLDFIKFPIFNVADVWLTLGVVVFLLHSVIFDKGENKHAA